jgi:Carboxypeptidase regulatory-like domain
MRKLFLSFAALGLLVSLGNPTSALAIDVYGRIRGTVTDQTGAVIAGATVSVVNTGTSITTTATSAADGSFELLQLPAPSTYNLKCEKAGFKAYVAEHIRLVVGQIYVQDIKMQLGQVTQQVTVEAAPTQVEKTSIQLGATVSASQIVDLPLNGRNWVQLQQTLPGVVAAADGRGNYSTNGSQTDQNSFLVNGVDTNDLPLNTPLVLPSPDSIAEFHMVTNTINPEYGRNSGAILNAITKSGSNSFHGSGFEFFRDTGLNARNFFKAKPDVFHQHQFGGTVGGPIWRDHTFFFFSYQGTRNAVPQAGGNVPVFTQDERNGYWPTVASSTKSSPFPLTGEDGTVYPAGTPYSNIFPTGHIPTVDFNPISVALMTKFVPLPNSGTDYTFNPSTTGIADQYITRIDHTIGSKDSLWGYWFWQRNPTTDTLPFTGATLPGFGETAKRHVQEYVLSWNHTFGPNSLNEARLGYTRFNFAAVTPINVLNPQSVGFTGINVQDPKVSSYPRIGVTGFFSLGFSSNGPQPRIDQTYQFDDNYTRIVGKHTFKVGFNSRAFQVYNPFFARLSGQFSFSSSGTYSTGNPGANFLLGIPTSYAQSGGDVINARSREYYSYFQDQFRVRPNITLTYGVGWSIDTPLVDNYHSNHAMIAFRPGQTSTLFPNAPTGYVFQGDPGVNATGTTKYGHFGPRLGFAWSPGTSGKWSVRGGYGIYFNRSLEEQALQFILSPPYGVSSGGVSDAGGGLSPSFAAPFVDIAGKGSIPNKFPAPGNPPSNIDFSGYLPLSINVADPSTTVPYAQNYNLTIERQLPGTAVATLAWVGAAARHLIITRELNPGIDMAGCAADPNCAGDPFQNTDFPNHFQYPGDVFGSIGNVQTTGVSSYNSLQATLNKHVSHGLQFYAVYTWSHAMDNGSGFENAGFGGGGFGGYGSIRGINPFNQTKYDKGPSAYDARHRFVINYTYDIPAIHHFDNWAAKRFFEGWRMSGVTTFQTGFPLDVVDGNFLSGACTAYTFYACPDTPDVIAPPQYANIRTSSFVNTATDPSNTASNNHYWFNPNTFVAEQPGTFGNAGRNLLRGPRIANFDWGFYKDTTITEQTRLELRFEFFNLWNHTQFNPSGVTTDISAGDFGRLVVARDPRLIQLAAKFYF